MNHSRLWTSACPPVKWHFGRGLHNLAFILARNLGALNI